MNFFKDHIAGIAALAIVTGIAATFLYDFLELKPHGTVFSRSTSVAASPGSTSDNLREQAQLAKSDNLRERFQLAMRLTWPSDRDPELEALVNEAIRSGDLAIAKEIAGKIYWADARDKAMRAILRAQR